MKDKQTKKKKREKVCGSERKTSVTICGIKMRKQRSAYKNRSMLINNVNKKKNKRLNTF